MELGLIIHGVFLGLLLSVLIGPVFFVLIETSIRHGMRDAILIDIGVLISDVVYLCFAYLGAEYVTLYINENAFVKYIGGGLIIAYGLYSMIKKKSPQKGTEVDMGKMKRASAFGLVSKGMALNAINPSVIVFWVVACTYAIETHQIEGYSVVAYFGTALLTMFAIDIFKIYSASKLKKKLTHKKLSTISVIVGAVLVFFGIVICFSDLKIPTH